MKNQLKPFCLFIGLFVQLQAHAMLGTSFTYQGELVRNNQPVNGTFDIQAKFYDAETNGNYLIDDWALATVINDGLFTVEFNIGSLYFNQNKDVWVEFDFTDTSDFSGFTLPRQLITNSPFAIHAQTVGDNGVSSNSIENGQVHTEDIADGHVTTSKLQDSAITSAKIADSTITGSDIASNTIGGSNITDHSITGIDIQAATITTVLLDVDAVSHNNMADNTVGSNELIDDSVQSVDIKDGTISSLDINAASIQTRVTGSCTSGSSIREINQNGSVVCETDDTGTAGWSMTGNLGTTAGTNFIGTTDNQDFMVKVNGNPIAKFIAQNNNIVLGKSDNLISNTFNNKNIIISGGGLNSVSGRYLTDGATISGGVENTISDSTYHSSYATIAGGNANSANREAATVSGGKLNSAKGLFSTVSGGGFNVASAAYSAVAGGGSNLAGGEYSFAIGRTAKVRDSTSSGDPDGDEGTFVWSSAANSFTSTGPQQFLIDSNEFGFGTNDPASAFHIKGQGTSTGSTAGSKEVVLTIEPEVTGDGVAAVLNKLSSSDESALIYSVSGSPEFDIRSNLGGSSLDINSFDISDNPVMMMRINDTTANRIDFNVNVEPQTDDSLYFGSSSYRWKTLYTSNVDTTNAVNVTSDKRLKEDIVNLKYGLAEILSLRPVSYSMKNDKKHKLHMGLIAQEVEVIVPEIVDKKNDEMQTRSMRYGELIPVLIKATQEQQLLIEQQSAQIEQLRQMVQDLMHSKESGF